jgi:Cof subfamily protein (haloacid dehalogenase superfamily)
MYNEPMQYKALMLDVDGTLIPYDYAALPSDTVSEALREAQKKVTVCLVTGRAYASVERILRKLSISTGYAAVNNGAQVVDISTKQIIAEQPIDQHDAESTVELLLKKQIPFYLKQDTFVSTIPGQFFRKGEKITKPYMIFTPEIFTLDQIEAIFEELSHFSNLTLHKGHHYEKGIYSFNITHAKATKLHGINVILEKTGITKEEVIAVGDGYNDFPLLMASGLRVAMGNAVDELKEIAVHIAPSVHNDGVAHVVNMFIKQNT